MFEAIGRLLGEILGAFLRGIAHIVRFRPEQLKEIREQTAVHSINPDQFQSAQVRALAEQVKQQLANSPDTLTEFAEVVHGPTAKLVFQILKDASNPPDVTSPEAAQAHVENVAQSIIDIIVFLAALDMVATAFSATLLRNMIHEFSLLLGGAGILAINTMMVQTALDTRVRPFYARQLNKQAKAMLPSASDMVRFELREVFRATERAQQLSPATSADFKRYMAELGYDDYWSDSYWAAHWDLPSITQLNEMLHRKVIDYATWETFVRRNDYLPAAIPLLAKIIYNPYTRVDIRRMWQLGVVTDEEVVRTYQDQGYDEEHARNLLLFTKVERSLPDIRRRYANGWINKAQALAEVRAIGLPEDRAQRLFQTIVKEEGPTRTQNERDLTRTDILNGIKRGVITEQQGASLLLEMGYDQFEVDFIILTYIEAISGSPETYLDYKAWVNKLRKAQGEQVKEIPQDVLDKEKEIQRLTARLAELHTQGAPQDEIDVIEATLATEEYSFRQLLKRHGLNPEEITGQKLANAPE